MIEMLHSSADQKTNDWIIQEFTSTTSIIRVLVSTIAFGMGVNIPDVEVVIHWGAPKGVLSYWQEVGRGGREGHNCVAAMYPYGRSLLKTKLIQKNVLERRLYFIS